MDIELNSCVGFDVEAARRLRLKRFAPAESRLRAQRLLKRRNYNTAERIRATLRGRTLRKFDAIIMLAIGWVLLFTQLKLTPGE